MRGSFNRTVDVYYGPRSVAGIPYGLRLSDIPCRKVQQNEITNVQPPFDLTWAWITLDGALLNGPTTLAPWDGALYTDYEAADIVYFDDLPLIGYLVCRNEWVTPVGSAPYYRWLLLPLDSASTPPWPPHQPLPPAPPDPDGPTPGTTCGGASPVAMSQSVSRALNDPDDSWWVLPAPGLATVDLVVTSYSAPGGAGLIIYGNTCGSLVVLDSVYAPGTFVLIVPAGWNVYVAGYTTGFVEFHFEP